MLSRAGKMYNYLHKRVYPPPPPPPPPLHPPLPDNAVYGYRWQAGQGVPNQLSIFSTLANAQPGIYIVFQFQHLDDTIDFFGRGLGDRGPLYTAPATPSNALQELIQYVQINPPPNEGFYFNNVTQQRLSDIDGFLSYVANCLDLINQTHAGGQLLQRLTTGQFSTCILPAVTTRGNQTAADMNRAVSTITQIITQYANGAALDCGAIVTMINQRYANINGTMAKYNQLANDIQSMPLYSLFVDENNFMPNFLRNRFLFRGVRISGQHLMPWLQPELGGFAAFDNFVRTDNTLSEGMQLRKYFLLALIFALYPVSPPGSGTGAGINFNVRLEDINDPANAEFRPPAIGLAHELMHAMHYARGTALGHMINHFTTTAAELLFAGITPFQNELVTENAVRNQWDTVVAPDPSNVWGAPARRVIYDPPPPGTTAAQIRQQTPHI